MRPPSLYSLQQGLAFFSKKPQSSQPIDLLSEFNSSAQLTEIMHQYGMLGQNNISEFSSNRSRDSFIDFFRYCKLDNYKTHNQNDDIIADAIVSFGGSNTGIMNCIKYCGTQFLFAKMVTLFSESFTFCGHPVLTGSNNGSLVWSRLQKSQKASAFFVDVTLNMVNILVGIPTPQYTGIMGLVEGKMQELSEDTIKYQKEINEGLDEKKELRGHLEKFAQMKMRMVFTPLKDGISVKPKIEWLRCQFFANGFLPKTPSASNSSSSSSSPTPPSR